MCNKFEDKRTDLEKAADHRQNQMNMNQQFPKLRDSKVGALPDQTNRFINVKDNRNKSREERNKK